MTIEISEETPESTPQPGIAERAMDTAADVSHTVGEVVGGLKVAVDRLTDVIKTARQPGHSLSTLSAITREAPLTSLCIAFLFGIAMARRR